MSDSLPETDAEWRARLTPDQYRICRQKGTEPAFTGAYWDEKTPGLYRCAGCGHQWVRTDLWNAASAGLDQKDAA